MRRTSGGDPDAASSFDAGGSGVFIGDAARVDSAPKDGASLPPTPPASPPSEECPKGGELVSVEAGPCETAANLYIAHVEVCPACFPYALVRVGNSGAAPAAGLVVVSVESRFGEVTERISVADLIAPGEVTEPFVAGGRGDTSFVVTAPIDECTLSDNRVTLEFGIPYVDCFF